MAKKVLIPQAVAEEAVEQLLEWGYEIRMGNGFTEEDLIHDVVDCDAILLRTAPCTRAVLEAGKRLKIVARHGAGYNNVDLDAADQLGIWVTNTPDATTNSVAEFTMGAVIAAAKRFYLLSDSIEKNHFFFKYANKGVDLKGKTLGIIGLGRIGSAVARKMHDGLDMEIIAYAPHADKRQLPDDVRLVGWETLFQESDFVSVHIPARKENENLIGKREFALMKPTAYFINCARGEVVDEAALLEALQLKKLAGAFLDVLKEEPFDPAHPLFGQDDVSITPHMASNTVECMREMACQAASQVHKVLSGSVPDWAVNHPAK